MTRRTIGIAVAFITGLALVALDAYALHQATKDY